MDSPQQKNDSTENINIAHDSFESIRKRPAMYIGRSETGHIIKSLIYDCINILGTDKITVTVSIQGDNDFTVSFQSDANMNRFLEAFNVNELTPKSNNITPAVLKAISDKLQITQEESETVIHFSIDPVVNFITNVDYQLLCEKVFEIALINRQIEIILKDTREKYLNQNYYHFPQGIFYVFNREIKKGINSELLVTFDGQIERNFYQIGLAYRRYGFPTSVTLGYANDITMRYQGVLIQGIFEGLVEACKSYVNINNITNFKIKSKKFNNGLILVCAVRGGDFNFENSFREILNEEDIRKQAKKLTKQLVLDFFKEHKEKSDDFLARFDTTNIVSNVF